MFLMYFLYVVIINLSISYRAESDLLTAIVYETALLSSLHLKFLGKSFFCNIIFFLRSLFLWKAFTQSLCKSPISLSYSVFIGSFLATLSSSKSLLLTFNDFLKLSANNLSFSYDWKSYSFCMLYFLFCFL